MPSQFDCGIYRAPSSIERDAGRVRLHRTPEFSDRHVIATTYADAQGNFSFANHKRGDLLEIRASRESFNSVQYTVSIALVGKGHLRMVIPVAA